jgi:hypothetical protein
MRASHERDAPWLPKDNAMKQEDTAPAWNNAEAGTSPPAHGVS